MSSLSVGIGIALALGACELWKIRLETWAFVFRRIAHHCCHIVECERIPENECICEQGFVKGFDLIRSEWMPDGFVLSFCGCLYVF